MIEEQLPYDWWIEDALRSVIRLALVHAAEHGLPGQHHFYITFRTDADGVEIAPDLRARYPDEMTIVLQHQFWDLSAEEEAFAVTLRFQGRPNRLRIPYRAIAAFGDPSVNFGLQLRRSEDGDTTGATPYAAADAPPSGSTRDSESVAADGNIIALDTFRKK